MQHTKTVTDQMGRTVVFSALPQRIISLVPSQTELLYDLGLTDEVVGQTLFCVHPQSMHQVKTRVGGTKTYKHEVIAGLKPDLIIGNKEENERSGIEQLEQRYPVWMSDIKTLEDALDMIARVGELTGTQQQATRIISRIATQFDELKEITSGRNAQRTAYLIWRKPWMVAGHSTFITEMLSKLGLTNVFTAETSRYPEVTEKQLAAAKPDLIFLSSEPYPFKQQHIEELQVVCPGARIMLVDGELFSWYGSRLLHSVPYFKELLQQINP